MDLVKTDEERTMFRLMFGRQVMAWPFAAPPGVPKDRVDALRKAFMETVTDKDFLADAGKANFEVRPVSGTQIQQLISDIYGTPPAVPRRPCNSCNKRSLTRSCGDGYSPLVSPLPAAGRDRMPIRDDIIDAIGNTPLIKLKRASEMTGCTILGKAEFMNPGQSVKDRPARQMILEAEKRGELEARRARGRGDRRQHRHRSRAWSPMRAAIAR